MCLVSYVASVIDMDSQAWFGLSVNGTTGEAQSLTVEERKAVAEAWVKHGKNK